MSLLEVMQAEQEVINERRRKYSLKVNSDGVFAVCFPGGGLLSATFCSGALAALAREKLLKNVDYLCSVSGGGYMAASFMSHLLIQIKSMREDTLDTAASNAIAKVIEHPKLFNGWSAKILWSLCLGIFLMGAGNNPHSTDWKLSFFGGNWFPSCIIH